MKYHAVPTTTASPWAERGRAGPLWLKTVHAAEFHIRRPCSFPRIHAYIHITKRNACLTIY